MLLFTEGQNQCVGYVFLQVLGEGSTGMLCSPETFQDRLKWKFVASKGATWGNWRPPLEDWWPIVLGYHIQGKQTEKQQGFWVTITTWTLVPFVLYYMQGTESTLSWWLLRKDEGDKNALIRYILTCRHFFLLLTKTLSSPWPNMVVSDGCPKMILVLWEASSC